MTAFGAMLKEWRAIRRYSQLELSLEADTSARHLSFLETGRSRPSRDMVLRLSQALEMPRGVANQALQVAGFAPAYPDLPDNAPDLTPINAAIDAMLAAHDPLPGIAIDRYWTVTAHNRGAQMLLGIVGGDGPANMVELIIASAQGNLLANWEEIAMLALTRLRTEILELGGDTQMAALAERLSSVDRLKQCDMGDIDLNQAVIPTRINLGETQLSLFSTIAQFGSVQDVRAGETRIELMFPADEATADFFRQ